MSEAKKLLEVEYTFETTEEFPDKQFYKAFSEEFLAAVYIEVSTKGYLDVKTVAEVEADGGMGLGIDFTFSKETPRFCKMYVLKLKAGSSPQGFVRKMMCNLLILILKNHPDISFDDGIFIYACGNTRQKVGEIFKLDGDYLKLIRLYEKIGFRRVAKINYEPKNCYIFLSTQISKILSYCKTLGYVNLLTF
jgi:hypothetical protein